MKKTLCDFCEKEVERSVTETATNCVFKGQKVRIKIQLLNCQDAPLMLQNAQSPREEPRYTQFSGDPCKSCFYEIVRQMLPTEQK